MTQTPPGQPRDRDDDADAPTEIEGYRDEQTAATDDDGAVSDDGDGPGQIPPDKRRERKQRDRDRCRGCGAAGPGAGGITRLNVHHADPDPDHCELHAMENLITLCEDCHSWIHKKPTASDVSITLSDADQEQLLPHDYEILRFLYREGPAMASDITTALTAEVTEVAVRERLWLLVGLDRIIGSRDGQLLDRDAETGEWGPPAQIAQSVRGRVPRDVQTLLQRIEDEVVRRAITRGCDRETVAAVLDIHKRTTWIKERRAYAHAFPLDTLSSGAGKDRVDNEHGNQSGNDML